jgi:hypothetical protein
MNLQQARIEIFVLMLKQERSNDPNEVVSVQWEIEEKITVLATLVQLDISTVEILLARQYADWLQNGGSDSEIS